MSESREVQRLREQIEAARHIGETRAMAGSSVEVRESSDTELVLTGHAAVFSKEPYDMGKFDERIAPGAFKRTLGESPDVVFWAAHGEGGHLPLARTKAGTLALAEDAIGLRYVARLDATDPDAQSLYRKVKRGDLDGASFMFRVTDDDWHDGKAGRQLRTIRSVSMHKGDVSPLAFGANPSAYVSARARQGAYDGADAGMDAKPRATHVRPLLDYTTGVRAWLDAEMDREARAKAEREAEREREWLARELERYR